MEFFHKVTRFPFMNTRKVWYGLSAVLIVASLALVAIRGLNLGVDFTGGVVVETNFPQAPNIEQLRVALASRMQQMDVERAAVGAQSEVLTAQIAEQAAAVWETANTRPLVKMDRDDIDAAWQKTQAALAPFATQDAAGANVTPQLI